MNLVRNNVTFSWWWYNFVVTGVILSCLVLVGLSCLTVLLFSEKIKLNNILRLPVFMDVKLPWIQLAHKQGSTGYNWL